MKKLKIDWSKNTAMAGAAAVCLCTAAQSAQAGSIFVIAMENHNLTQPVPTNNPQQILGNPAAPYINSLMTPGNPNAIQTSWAMRYFNAGVGVHPSEPNYVWAEAGTDFGIHTDAVPLATNHNVFTAPHLTAQFIIYEVESCILKDIAPASHVCRLCHRLKY